MLDVLAWFTTNIVLFKINPLLRKWFRDRCLTCDVSSTITVFPLMFIIGHAWQFNLTRVLFQMVKVILQYCTKWERAAYWGGERQFDGHYISHSAGSVTTHIIGQICDGSLKVLTNEKRGGLTVVSLDRSHFKGAQVWDFRSLRFSLFLHHKAFLGRWLCG